MNMLYDEVYSIQMQTYYFIFKIDDSIIIIITLTTTPTKLYMLSNFVYFYQFLSLIYLNPQEMEMIDKILLLRMMLKQ